MFSAHIQVREQRIALEYGVDLALVGRYVVQVAVPSKSTSPESGLLKAADDAQRGGFAAARRAEQGHKLAALNGQRNAAQHRRPVKFLFQVSQIDQILIQSSSLSPNR